MILSAADSNSVATSRAKTGSSSLFKNKLTSYHRELQAKVFMESDSSTENLAAIVAQAERVRERHRVRTRERRQAMSLEDQEEDRARRRKWRNLWKTTYIFNIVY